MKIIKILFLCTYFFLNIINYNSCQNKVNSSSDETNKVNFSSTTIKSEKKIEIIRNKFTENENVIYYPSVLIDGSNESVKNINFELWHVPQTFYDHSIASAEYNSYLAKGTIVKADYEITFQTDDLLSVIFTFNFYYKNGLVAYNLFTLNFNLKTDKEIYPGDMVAFSKLYLNDINESLYTLKNYKGDIITRESSKKDDLFGTYLAGSMNYFYFTENSLGFLIPLAEYSVDYVRAEIPYEDIDEKDKKKSYLWDLIK